MRIAVVQFDANLLRIRDSSVRYKNCDGQFFPGYNVHKMHAAKIVEKHRYQLPNCHSKYANSFIDSSKYENSTALFCYTSFLATTHARSSIAVKETVALDPK